VRRFWRTFALAALVLVVGAGCGVSGQQRASVIPRADVPSALWEPSPPPVSPSPAYPAATIYLVEAKDGVLVPVHRSQQQASTLFALMQSLLAGPTDAEVSRGLTSALTAVSKINNVSRSGTLATIDLGSSFSEIRGQSQILATAQIVLTAVSFPGVDSVLIELDGHPVTVPLADGTLTSRPLRADDYSCLLVGSRPCAPSSESPPPPVNLPSPSATASS